MKHRYSQFIPSLVLGLILTLSAGCANLGKGTRKAITELETTIGVVLEILVPHDFEGNLTLRSSATGLGYDLKFTGLRWSAELDRYTWDGLVWGRDGIWTTGGIELESIPRR